VTSINQINQLMFRRGSVRSRDSPPVSEIEAKIGVDTKENGATRFQEGKGYFILFLVGRKSRSSALEQGCVGQLGVTYLSDSCTLFNLSTQQV
jgi:hypothetical protein